MLLSVRILASIVFLLSLHVKTYGQEVIDWNEVHNKTIEAIDALYNLDFQLAERKCNELNGIAPKDPRGHFFKAMMYYYRYTLVSKSEKDYNRFVGCSHKVAEVCDNILENNEKDAKALFYKGGIIGYRGLTKFNRGDHSGAFWDGKEALSSLESALEYDPNNPDIQMGFGLFNYLISQAPKTLRPILKAVGLEGDKVKGLKQLENAAKNGLYCKNEAKRWLSIFYDWEDMHNHSASSYKSLLVQYPKNSWLRLGYINLIVNHLRNPDLAIQETKEMEIHNRIEFKRPFGTACLLSGIANYLKGDLEEAFKWYDKCISLNADSQQVKSAYWYYGKTLEVMGNRKEGWNYYIKSGYNKNDYITPLTSNDILRIKCENLFQAGRYEASAALENQILNSNMNDDEKGKALYPIGRSFYELRKFSEAIKVFNKMLQLQPKKDMWIPPYSLFRLGQAYASNGDSKLAAETFTKALQYENYSSEENLKKMVTKELNKLRRKS